MPAKKLKEFLDGQHVKYVTITHAPSYTAQEIAQSSHIPGEEMAKSVVVKLDDTMALAVMPATRRVDLEQLREIAGAEKAELATEHEFANTFTGCEVGAMPPFGNLYGMDVYVDESLAADEHIAFNAGSHTELMQLDYADFERLVEPKLARLT
jgi:Ala-tRNA(Pro) deacylase